MLLYKNTLAILATFFLFGCGEKTVTWEMARYSQPICQKLEKAATCGHGSDLLLLECIDDLKKATNKDDMVLKIEQKIDCLAKEPKYCEYLNSTDEMGLGNATAKSIAFNCDISMNFIKGNVSKTNLKP